MPVLLAICLVILVGAALFIQARQFEAVIKKLEGLERGGVLVNMDSKGPAIPTAAGTLTLGQRRRALEKASRARAAAKNDKITP